MSSSPCNRAYLTGVVGRAAESRPRLSGGALVTLSVAVPRAIKVDSTFVDSPDWFTVRTSDPTIGAQLLSMPKGSRVSLECSMRPLRWSDRDGHTHTDIALHVDRVISLGRAAD